MRKAFAIGMLLLAIPSMGQDSQDLFLSDRPDVTIVVRKSGLGTDDITVTVEKEYSPEVLKSQAEALARSLNSELRGLAVDSYNPNPANKEGGYWRATFGVLGLVQREKSSLGLQALARAFASREPAVDSLFIQYESEAPNTGLVQQWRAPDGSVVLQGRASPVFGIEYRIKLNTSDPQKIRIPEGSDAKDEQKKPTPKKEPPPESTDWWLWPLIIVSALAIGALVYSVLLRPKPRPRAR
jgi:hypothetical protein